MIFCLSIVGYYVLTILPWVDRWVIYPVLEATARASAWLLNVCGGGISVHGVILQGADFSVRVQRGCDPLEPIVLFGTAVLAFPAPIWKKVWGFTAGSVLLFGINLVRVASLYLAGRMHTSWFESIHQEIWPALFIALAVLLWLTWLYWVVPARRGKHA